MREFKDVIAVWLLNLCGYLWENFDVFLQRVSVILAIIYTVLRLYDWYMQRKERKDKDKVND